MWPVVPEVLRDELLVAAEGVAIVEEETVGYCRDCTLSLCLACALLPFARDCECEEVDEEAELSLPAALLCPRRELSFPCNVTAFAGPTVGAAEEGSSCTCSGGAGSCVAGPCAGPGALDGVVIASMACRAQGMRCQKGAVVPPILRAVCVGWQFHVSSLTVVGVLCRPLAPRRWALQQAIWGG